jgi:hypothetical protein
MLYCFIQSFNLVSSLWFKFFEQLHDFAHGQRAEFLQEFEPLAHSVGVIGLRIPIVNHKARSKFHGTWLVATFCGQLLATIAGTWSSAGLLSISTVQAGVNCVHK